MNPFDFTPEETAAMQLSEELLLRAMKDDVPVEVYLIVLAEYNNLTQLVYAARRLRVENANKNFIQRLFRK
jgi:hypothetical protein